MLHACVRKFDVTSTVGKFLARPKDLYSYVLAFVKVKPAMHVSDGFVPSFLNVQHTRGHTKCSPFNFTQKWFVQGEKIHPKDTFSPTLDCSFVENIGEASCRFENRNQSEQHNKFQIICES